MEAPTSAAERRLRVLSEGARDVVVETDLGGVVRYVSPSIRDVLGYAPEEVVGRVAASFLHPEDRESLRPVPDADQPDTYRYRVRRRDGALRWVESVTRPLLDERGAPVGRVSAARDVTRRVEAEEALRASEARWRSLVENAAEYVYTVDPDMRITFLNRDAPGRPREAIVGQPVTAWSPPEEHAQIAAAYARVFGAREVATH